MTSKERLEQYIKGDKIYNDWLDENTSYVSDFDRFCIQHCEDIKCLLEENEKLKQWDNNKDSRNSRQRVTNSKLLKENQKLRKKLDELENPKDLTLMFMYCDEKAKDKIKELNQKYVNAVADYETTMAEKEQLNSLVNSCQEEIRKLKKQVEELEVNYKSEHNMRVYFGTQQKGFIKYLEDLIKQNETVVEVSKYGLPKNCSKLLIDFYKEILSKYKEKIGDDK